MEKVLEYCFQNGRNVIFNKYTLGLSIQGHPHIDTLNNLNKMLIV